MANYTIEKYHGSYNKTYNGSTSRKYIVVHYTGAGTSAPGCARNNCIYFSGGNRNASADYFIDDGSIYEYNDPKSGYYSWHCGDGGGAYGITNANSIGIEVCMNGDNPYTAAEIDRLTWLVQKLMKDFNISSSNVVRHYDASRKLCPYYYAQRPNEWVKLREQITGGKVSGSTTPSTPSTPSTSTPTQNGSIKAGTYTVLVNDLNVRTAPTTSAQSVAKYNKGNKVTLDGWSTKANGCIWGRYIGASSGQYRYIAVQVEGGATYASIGGTTSGSTSSSAPAKKDVATVAQEVINGKWGNGDDRKRKLEAAGYNYSEVQAKVNQMLGAGGGATNVNIDALARDVIAGKYGNGDARKKALGSNYTAVQKRVNEILSGK